MGAEGKRPKRAGTNAASAAERSDAAESAAGPVEGTKV